MSEKEKQLLPSVERRVKYELAKRGWSEADLRRRIRDITGKKVSTSRMTYLICRTKNPNTKTLSVLAEALGMPVRRFFEEELEPERTQ